MGILGRWAERGKRLVRLAGKVRRLPSWLKRAKAFLCQMEKLHEDTQTLLSLQASVLEANVYLIEASQCQAGQQSAAHEEVLSLFGRLLEQLKERHDRAPNADAGQCLLPLPAARRSA